MLVLLEHSQSFWEERYWWVLINGSLPMQTAAGVWVSVLSCCVCRLGHHLCCAPPPGKGSLTTLQSGPMLLLSMEWPLVSGTDQTSWCQLYMLDAWGHSDLSGQRLWLTVDHPHFKTSFPLGWQDGSVTQHTCPQIHTVEGENRPARVVWSPQPSYSMHTHTH